MKTIMRMSHTHAAGSRHLALGIAPLIALFALAGSAPGCVGEAGPAGANGNNGAPGDDGTNGPNGVQGGTGKDGASPVVDQSLPPVQKALLAIGGKDALQKLKTFTINAAGSRSVLGEGNRSDDPAADVGTFTLALNYDLGADNLHLDYQRKITVLGLNAEKNFKEILLGNLGYIDGSEHIFNFPAGNMVSDRWASIRKQQRLLNPHLILRDAATDATRVSDGGVAILDGSVHQLVKVKDKSHPVTLFVNSQTGTIDKATTTENDHLERDVELEVFYQGWKPANGGLLFPTNVYIAKDGEIVHQEARSAIKVNEGIDAKLFAFPPSATPEFDQAAADRGDACSQFHQGFASFGIPLDGLQTFVKADEVVPGSGAYYLTGGSHNSMAIEQEKGIVIIEAPLYEQRSEEILKWVKATFPTKPVTHVIATHFHTDHAAGLRRFVAEGAKIVVGAAEADFFKEVFRASSTILPDALSKAPKAAVLIPVPNDGFITIDDLTNPVAAYHLDSEHAAGMLMGYLPIQKVAFQSDLYNPASPAAVPPPFLKGAMELYNSIVTTHKLPVSFIAGGHGGPPNTFADFKTALGL
jgi:glyoxylase-like metal-dependent hydrolase (beta-lactamase superfamily II)